MCDACNQGYFGCGEWILGKVETKVDNVGFKPGLLAGELPDDTPSSDSLSDYCCGNCNCVGDKDVNVTGEINIVFKDTGVVEKIRENEEEIDLAEYVVDYLVGVMEDNKYPVKDKVDACGGLLVVQSMINKGDI